MYTLGLYLLGLSIAVIAACCINFPFLLYPFVPNLNPMTRATRLSLIGDTLFISDLHLKAGRQFGHSQNLHNFLRERHVPNLIVVGDLFNSPKDAKQMLSGGASSLANILGVNDLPVKAFFVEGSPSHDPRREERDALDGILNPIGQCAILSFNHFRVVAYHGHDMSRKGAIGHGWDRFISSLSLERAWKRVARISDSDWVIFGHTHIPGIDAKHRVANCGGWQEIGFLVRPACTGIYLSPEKESMEVVKFD
jgi:predicted phosphodiesterase